MKKHLRPGIPSNKICPCQESSPTSWQRDLFPQRGTTPRKKQKKYESGELSDPRKSQIHPSSMFSWSRPHCPFKKIFHTPILTPPTCAIHNTSLYPAPQQPTRASKNTALTPVLQPPTCVSHNTSLTPVLQTPTYESHKISTTEMVKPLINYPIASYLHHI